MYYWSYRALPENRALRPKISLASVSSGIACLTLYHTLFGGLCCLEGSGYASSIGTIASTRI